MAERSFPATSESMIKTNSNQNRTTIANDAEVDWGFRHSVRAWGGGGGGEEWVFGYNAHVVADANYGIPLAVAVTLGNQSDTNYLTPLVEETGQRPDVVIADRGYDSAPNNKWLHER